MSHKAIIIGSTGLIGTHLLELLLADENYSEIIALVRKPVVSPLWQLCSCWLNFK